jgi:predicted SnoaL-like aldol condensation-catalyzing enzyme
MRKILFFILPFFSFAFFSCDHVKVASASDSSAAQKNLEAHRMITKTFETGDVSGIDSVIADDFVDHTDRGDMVGKDSLKSMIKWSHDNMKDMKMKAVKELADDDYVMAWMNMTGTSDGSMGMPKGPFDMNSIEVSKFRDGKAVEHWSFVNMQEMMKMMGGGMPGGGMDSTKKK